MPKTNSSIQLPPIDEETGKQFIRDALRSFADAEKVLNLAALMFCENVFNGSQWVDDALTNWIEVIKARIYTAYSDFILEDPTHKLFFLPRVEQEKLLQRGVNKLWLGALNKVVAKYKVQFGILCSRSRSASDREVRNIAQRLSEYPPGNELFLCEAFKLALKERLKKIHHRATPAELKQRELRSVLADFPNSFLHACRSYELTLETANPEQDKFLLVLFAVLTEFKEQFGFYVDPGLYVDLLNQRRRICQELISQSKLRAQFVLADIKTKIVALVIRFAKRVKAGTDDALLLKLCNQVVINYAGSNNRVIFAKPLYATHAQAQAAAIEVQKVARLMVVLQSLPVDTSRILAGLDADVSPVARAVSQSDLLKARRLLKEFDKASPADRGLFRRIIQESGGLTGKNSNLGAPQNPVAPRHHKGDGVCEAGAGAGCSGR